MNEVNFTLSSKEIDSSLNPLDVLEEDTTPPPNPEEMLIMLESEDVQKRMLAARAFCELTEKRSIPHLINLLNDVCPLVRVSVAYALGRNTSSEVVQPLINTLANDWNGYVRKGIVWSLGNSGDRRAFKPLLHALKTDISAVRLWAATSLSSIAKLEYENIITAIPHLIIGLRQDKIAAVRSNCAWSIGQLCRELPLNVVYATAIDALIEALVEDEDLGVKEDAKASLLKVGDPRGIQMIEDLEIEGLI
jgi:HEAT repeat protein